MGIAILGLSIYLGVRQDKAKAYLTLAAAVCGKICMHGSEEGLSPDHSSRSTHKIPYKSYNQSIEE
jgi:hypothetical protein